MSEALTVSDLVIDQPGEIDQPEWWAADAVRGEALPPRKKRCHECPADDMYADFADDLARQPPDVQAGCLARWFCHVTPGKSCRGAAERVALRAAGVMP